MNTLDIYTAYGTSNKPAKPDQGRLVVNLDAFEEPEEDALFGKTSMVAFTDRLGNPKTIGIPADADAWQLYSTNQNAGQAAHRLTKALVEALNKLAEVAVKDGIDIAVNSAEDIMSKARIADAQYGATDTEPRSLSHQVICDFARAYMGSDRTFYHLL